MGRQPNVVMLVLDTLRRDRVSLYNDGVTFTEHLAALGEESLVFEDAIAQAPWTLPSHASMFAGTYPWEHGATQQSPVFDPAGETLIDRFNAAGYRTGGFSPNPWVSPFSGVAEGFETWETFLTPGGFTTPSFVRDSRLLERWSNGRFERLKSAITDVGISIYETWTRRRGARTDQSERVLDRGRRFVEGSAPTEPFFLYLNLLDVHEPYYPPERYLERHAPGVDPREENRLPARQLGDGGAEDVGTIARLYDACVDRLDDRVGGFVEFLRDTGRLEDTVLVVLSDHGQALGEKGLYGHQFGVDQALTRVPLLIRTPSAAGEVVDGPVELRELYDLLPALAGLRSPYNPGVDVALGGYGYPDLAIRQLPRGARDEHYRRFRFVADRTQYVVRTEAGDGVFVSAVRRDTGEEVPPDPDLVDRLPDHGEGDTKRSDVSFPTPVAERLEALGYR